MTKMWEWIKNNKIATALIVMLAFFAIGRGGNYNLARKIAINNMGSPDMMYESYGRGGTTASVEMGMPMEDDLSFTQNYANNDIQPSDRMVQENANASAVVDDVRNSVDDLKTKAESVGGFMVRSNFNKPGETANGYVTVRIPNEELRPMLSYLEKISVNVVSETIYANDVTERYTDIEKNIAIYEKTLAKYNEILDQATEINDILNVTNNIITVQRQIDNLKGQQEYLEETTATSLLSVNLSTDEFALPYVPDEEWRPGVTFKLAIRSLVLNARNFGNLAIWTAVYSPVILAGVGGYILVKRFRKGSKQVGGSDNS